MLVLPLLLLAGCETLSQPTPPPDTPSPTPTLNPVTGAGYTTRIPPGWVSRLDDAAEKHRFSAGGEAVLLLERRPLGPVQRGINDVPASIAMVRLRDRIPDEKVVGYLKNFPGTTLIEPPKHYAVGADEGVQVTYSRRLEGTPVDTLDMVVNHHDRTYEMFLNTVAPLFPDQSLEVATIMDAWSWADGP